MQNALKQNLATINVCVCSFSEASDSLSQWRAYAMPSGFAIGFPGNFLREIAQTEHFYFAPCFYKPTKQREIIRALVDEVLYELLNPNLLSGVCWQPNFLRTGCWPNFATFARLRGRPLWFVNGRPCGLGDHLCSRWLCRMDAVCWVIGTGVRDRFVFSSRRIRAQSSACFRGQNPFAETICFFLTVWVSR
jgi:hypothetical protein